MVAVGLFAVYAPGLWRRIPILIGAIVGYVVYYDRGERAWATARRSISRKIGAAAWFGLPNFRRPVFDPQRDDA